MDSSRTSDIDPLTRPGWLLSLSTWADEKALVRWRTRERHHLAQERVAAKSCLDYHPKEEVGQILSGGGEVLGRGRRREDPEHARLTRHTSGRQKVVVLFPGRLQAALGEDELTKEELASRLACA